MRNEYKEYGVGIYPDDLDMCFEALDEAQDACSDSYFFGLDCYIYGIDRYGSRTYIEKRLATDNALFVTDSNGRINITHKEVANAS